MITVLNLDGQKLTPCLLHRAKCYSTGVRLPRLHNYKSKTGDLKDTSTSFS